MRSPARVPRMPRVQAPVSAVVAGWQASLLGPGAAMVSGTTGRPRYTGGALQPQRFVRYSASGPNDPATLALAPRQINARVALNRARGRM